MANTIFTKDHKGLCSMRFLATILTILITTSAHASCNGSDLRGTLSTLDNIDVAMEIAQNPFPVGNRWRAEKQGLILHLVGTMHLPDPRFDAIVERLAPLIFKADLVMLEVAPKEQAKLDHALSSNLDLVFITDGPTLPERLDETTWQQLRLAMRDRGIPSFVAAKMQPWYASLILGMPGCAIRTAAGQPEGLDQLIIAAAENANIPMQSLEPYDTIFRLFGQDPLDEQLRFLKLSLTTPEQSEDQFATLLGSYFDEAHGEAWAYARIAARMSLPAPHAEIDALFEKIEQMALIERNQNWMAKIRKLNSGNVIIAVGALHLTGEYGLLNMLHKDGFELTRERF